MEKLDANRPGERNHRRQLGLLSQKLQGMKRANSAERRRNLRAVLPEAARAEESISLLRTQLPCFVALIIFFSNLPGFTKSLWHLVNLQRHLVPCGGQRLEIVVQTIATTDKL